MNKSLIVDSTCNKMRLDRYLRNKLGNIPQSLIEKNLRSGKIKLNKKKTKSSTKVNTNDRIDLYNFNFQEKIIQKKIKFNPTNQIIKANEDLIIDDNENFIVLNKNSGISVQGGTKSKKNLIDIFSKSEIFKNTKPYSVHRLDKDTSGVFIMAKNRETAQLLTSLFRLRKQLFNIGHSIYGDKKYNSSLFTKGINKDLMLHSYQIRFMINEKKYTYRALLPDYFKKLLKTKRLNFVN